MELIPGTTYQLELQTGELSEYKLVFKRVCHNPLEGISLEFESLDNPKDKYIFSQQHFGLNRNVRNFVIEAFDKKEVKPKITRDESESNLSKKEKDPDLYKKIIIGCEIFGTIFENLLQISIKNPVLEDYSFIAEKYLFDVIPSLINIKLVESPVRQSVMDELLLDIEERNPERTAKKVREIVEDDKGVAFYNKCKEWDIDIAKRLSSELKAIRFNR